MTKRQAAQAAKIEQLVDRWNAAHPFPAPVIVTKDDKREVKTTTRSDAWVLGGHTAVVMVIGISGGYLLERVRFDATAEVAA